MVLRLCSKLNPAMVLGPLRSTLNQPVLLSLLHNISIDLTTYMELRFSWIQEVLMKLNPKVRILLLFARKVLVLLSRTHPRVYFRSPQDPEISEYCSLVLPQLQQRLQERYYQLATSEDQPNPRLLQTVQILTQAVIERESI